MKARQRHRFVINLTDQQRKLLAFVKKAHAAIPRKYNGEPYYMHLLDVAAILWKYGLTKNYEIEIALGHDLFEDTNVSKMQLSKFLQKIGYDIHERTEIIIGIEVLTDVYTKAAYPKLNRAERKYRESLRLSSGNKYQQNVKYADMIANLPSITYYDLKFCAVVVDEFLTKINEMRRADIRLMEELFGLIIKAKKKIANQ